MKKFFIALKEYLKPKGKIVIQRLKDLCNFAKENTMTVGIATVATIISISYVPIIITAAYELFFVEQVIVFMPEDLHFFLSFVGIIVAILISAVLAKTMFPVIILGFLGILDFFKYVLQLKETLQFSK